MASSDEDNQRAARTREHIRNVDNKVASPSVRAGLVWEFLRIEQPHLTDWDLICFAVEFLGMMTHTHPWLEEDVKSISKLVYTAHYLTPETDVTSGLERRGGEVGKSVDPQEGSDTSRDQEGHSDRIVR